MTSADIELAVRATYAVHVIMFGCGLEPDEVEVTICRVQNAPTNDPYVTVIARRGDLQYVAWLAPLPRTEDIRAFRKAWLSFANRQSTTPRAELDRIVHRSQAYLQLPEIVMGLIDKGIVPPGSGSDMLDEWNREFRPKPGEKPS